jgi:hypothetical protein
MAGSKEHDSHVAEATVDFADYPRQAAVGCSNAHLQVVVMVT